MTAIDERALGAAIIEGSNMAGERLVTQIVTAYLEALGTDGSRDVKSAPKDGTVIDVWCSSDHPGDDGGYRVANAYWSSVGHKWLHIGQGNSMTWAHQPTHWRPLPEPPSAMLSAAGGE